MKILDFMSKIYLVLLIIITTVIGFSWLMQKHDILIKSDVRAIIVEMVKPEALKSK